MQVSSPKIPFDCPSLILPRVSWAEASVAAEPTKQPQGEDEHPSRKLASVDKFTLSVWPTPPGLTLWAVEGARENLRKCWSELSSGSLLVLTRSLCSAETGQKTSGIGGTL